MPLKDFTKEKFDILIQAGQSNSDGTSFGSVEHPYQPNDKVWYLNADFTISIAQEKVCNNAPQGNFGLTFAKEYIDKGRLEEGRKILILRSAVGGTGFLTGQWKLTDPLYLRMMEMIRTALALNPENRLVALLWHQGEEDVSRNASFDVHYNHVMTLLKSVRDEFGVPELPFIAGDFVYDWKKSCLDRAEPVEKATRAVCKDAGHSAFVETSDLQSNREDGLDGQPHPLGWVDTIHFSRKSIYELGKRYFAAFEEIVK